MGNPVLVIEDDRKIARIIKVYLEGAGFRVIHAEKAEDAMEAVSKPRSKMGVVWSKEKRKIA